MSSQFSPASIPVIRDYVDNKGNFALPARIAAAYDPGQARYPKGHPQGGQWMPEGETEMVQQPGETAKQFRKRVARSWGRVDSMPNDVSRYFDADLATAPVAVVEVSGLETTRAREEGIENAEKLMAAAAAGVIPRRKPLDLRLEDDGSYTVLDGNSTTAVARKFGIDRLMGQIVERAPRAQAVADSVKGMIERQRTEVLPDYLEGLDKVVEGIPGASKIVPGLKGVVRGTEKALVKLNKFIDSAEDHNREILFRMSDAENAGYDVGKIDEFVRGSLADIVRGTVVIDRVSQKGAAVSRLAEVFGESAITELEDRFANPTPVNYSDVSAKLRVNGRLTEIQINIPEMIRAKEKAHPLYERMRSPNASEAAVKSLGQQQTQIYGGAKVDHTERTGDRF